MSNEEKIQLADTITSLAPYELSLILIALRSQDTEDSGNEEAYNCLFDIACSCSGAYSINANIQQIISKLSI